MAKKSKKKVGGKAVNAQKSRKATGKVVSIGDTVMYVPNGVDYGSRPKNQPMPAQVQNVYEQTFTTGEKSDKRTVTRSVTNLLILQDTETGHTRRVRVPHKSDALEGEVYFETAVDESAKEEAAAEEETTTEE